MEARISLNLQQSYPGRDPVPHICGPQFPGGRRDLLHEAQPRPRGRGGQEVRGRQHLDQPQEQEDKPECHRTLSHQIKRRCKAGLVLLQVGFI